MKKEIENREDLLRNLALKGDSHAFFSLSAPYFKARYLRERNTGATHPEAQMRVLAEATELLEKLQHVTPARIDAWFEEHCMIIASSDSDLQEANPDRKLFAETATFLNRCSRDLLTSSSQMKRDRRLRDRRFPRIIFGNPIVKSLLIAGLAIGFCFATVLLMTLFEASIHLSFETPGRQFSLRIPMTIPDDGESADLIPASKDVDTSSITKKVSESNLQPNPAHVPSETTTDIPNPRPAPPPATLPASSPITKARPLPPVIPKARMVLPPMPPQPVDPAAAPATPPADELVPPQTTPAPSQPIITPPGAAPAN